MNIHPVAALFPLLPPDELQDLAADIQANGLLHPIVMQNSTLLDGRNRLAACELANLDPRFEEYQGDSPVAFIIGVNLKRRHLAIGQKVALAIEIEPYFAAEAKKRHDEQAKRNLGIPTVGHFPPSAKAKSRDQAAAAVGVSGKTVSAAKAIKATSPERFEKIKQGKLTVARAKQEIKAEQREATIAQTARTAPQLASIINSDWRTFLTGFADHSIDLLLTDPPYSTDVDDIKDFAYWLKSATPKLKSTGRAYVCIGPYPIELLAYLEVLRHAQWLDKAQILVWTYRNTLGPTPKTAYKNNWQAVIYLCGAKAGALDCPIMLEQFSVQEINAPDGRQGDRYHAWQKPIELAERFVRHSTQMGDLVVDPFAGTGTFLLAAARLGRQAVGCENNKDMLKIAQDRGCIIRDD